MEFFLATHGKRATFIDPPHSLDGIEQIIDLSRQLTPYLELITGFATGTGQRFMEMPEIIKSEHSALKDVPIIDFSPFLGLPDMTWDISGKPSMAILRKARRVSERQCKLEIETVPVNQYGWIHNRPGFYPLEFLEYYPRGTLFCTGRPFLKCLMDNLEIKIVAAGASFYILSTSPITLKKVIRGLSLQQKSLLIANSA